MFRKVFDYLRIMSNYRATLFGALRQEIVVSKTTAAAQSAAALVREIVAADGGEMPGAEPVGVILGTGWGDKLRLSGELPILLQDLPGFEGLRQLGDFAGHQRLLCIGRCNGRPVVALRGRIHLNEEPANRALYRMVRLQTELLIALGARKLIATCSAGALPGSGLATGEIVVIDGFVTAFAPDMPLYGGEFCSPEDVLSEELQQLARASFPLGLSCGGYAMLRGPFFEGRRYDKKFIASSGAKLVGMSMLPEACIASLYAGVQMLALAFVSNGATEQHSHEANLQRAEQSAGAMGSYLAEVIARV